mmetsp:Transcript_29683/g.44792  ORF Transcript_29683/g.44792 Transcript_29683/m.44792 type:complete len:178 (-) Transcript_29683:572-1105(-)
MAAPMPHQYPSSQDVLMPDLNMLDHPNSHQAHAAAVLVAMAAAAPSPPSAEVQASWTEETDYSEKYCDDVYEYRRVTVPRDMLRVLPQGRCMEEREWRSHGITMSRGWEHYDHHSPEANVLLFRRVLGTDPSTGQIPPEMKMKVQAREDYIAQLQAERSKMMAAMAARQDQLPMDMF